MTRQKHSNELKNRMETFHYEPPKSVAHSDKVERVAAYCRVSTLYEEQELSFETQREFYKNLILNDPSKTLVGIYADQGFSGLDASKRKEFQRMMADCEAGKIDVILVKSISRFSRNTVECMEYLQKLKKNGIGVIFEKEGLNSLDSRMEMILSIYATMAQTESSSTSENLRWAKQRRAEMGDPVRYACYGYRAYTNPVDKRRYWKIHEEEAKRIRLMFDMAYKGYSTVEITEKLNEYENANGSKPWSYGRVRDTLQNEAYRGDILTHKYVSLDYLNRKLVRNKGLVDQY